MASRIVHLLPLRGPITPCARHVVAEVRCEADINFVTCRKCIATHDRFLDAQERAFEAQTTPIV